MNASRYKSTRLSVLGSLMAGLLSSGASWADLDPASTLNIASGSFFTMGGGSTVAAPGFDGQSITGLNGLSLGTTQVATGSHSGVPGCTNGVGSCNNPGENPGIDNPWSFFNNTGMHLSTSNTTVLTASGNTATVDFSGWSVSWNGIAVIPMNSGAWNGNANGVAAITCGVDCGNGDTYTLTYSATVPAGDPSNFGGTAYLLRLTGTITAPVAPVAGNIALPTLQSTAANWTPDVFDANGDTLTCDGTQPPAGEGTVVIDSNCGLSSYDPGAFVGVTSFSYWANDGTSDSNIATVTVTVSATPAPIAVNDAASTRINVPVDIDVTANDTDADGNLDVTSVAIATGASNGTTSVNGVTGVVTYTPNANFSGTDSFTYTIDDLDSQTSDPAATVTITVTANVVPIALPDNATTNVDTAVEINVLANDSDPDGGTLDVATVTATDGTNGSTSVNLATGRVTYTPNPGFAGLDTFTYTVDDNDGGTSNSTTVTVSVLSGGASAMPPNATLRIDAGSNFTMEVQPGDHIPTTITGLQGLKTFVAQTAYGSHTGAPNGTETPGVDNPWNFFGNTGMHGTTTPARVLSATGNTATLDLSGWFVTWNGIAQIPMSNRPWGSNAAGVAHIVCSVDCGDGDTYTLTYTATVPNGDPSGFGNVAYGLNLRGTIQVIATVDASGSSGTPVLGSGSEGGSSATSYQIALASLPIDSDYDAIGTVFDFSISGVGVGGTAVVTLNLGQALPANAIYRKYTSATGWSTFDTSTGDLIESGASVGGECAAGVAYSAGLTAGNDCMRLTIVDGGVNDGDRSLNGTVFDPGVVVVPAAAPFVDTRTSGSSGCTLTNRPVSIGAAGDWLLIGATLAGLGLVRRRVS